MLINFFSDVQFQFLVKEDHRVLFTITNLTFLFIVEVGQPQITILCSSREKGGDIAALIFGARLM